MDSNRLRWFGHIKRTGPEDLQKSPRKDGIWMETNWNAVSKVERPSERCNMKRIAMGGDVKQ